MKKTIINLAFLLSLTTSVYSASTLTFGSTSVFATNWANGSGVGGSLMVWGVLVDTNNDGFRNGEYVTTGLNYTTGQYILSTSSGVTDDVLFIAPTLMSLTPNGNTNDGLVSGTQLNRITGISNMLYTNGVGGDDDFGIMWFDKTALSGSAAASDKYGFFTIATPGNSLTAGTQAATGLSTGFELTGDGASSYTYSNLFSGADTLKTMNFALAPVPETSTTLLGAIGALALLRRRRN